ncbi:hypothetical protein BU16DRAFT_594610 [Lophium mytilinum]|uniref:Uncharacterized protein n=1 Tax=Lophium mytilinum TaxID=390894 RepID=A0A6A6QHR9_9PEZI|nr:hypothetical protein BU16DRAFT_594610 [Lophium mytilinum]
MAFLTLLTSSITQGLHATAAILVFSLTLALLAIPTLLLCKSGFILPNPTPTPAAPTPPPPNPPNSSASSDDSGLAGAPLGVLFLAHLYTTAFMAPAQGGMVGGSVKSGLVVGTVVTVFLSIRLVGEALVLWVQADSVRPAARVGGLASEVEKNERGSLMDG